MFIEYPLINVSLLYAGGYMRKQNDKIEDEAIESVSKYLRNIGWKPLVGGFSGIEQGSRKYNFRLIFSFTGKKK